ncbi:MAG TPA: hypothetical protein PKN33_15650 [Phycisphaerae bacterium]|nr:hypothetical protein [Phycisphaerae bacterium]
MWITLIFWFGLIFAGAVAVKRWTPETFRGGPMAVIAVGFVAALAILSPISILCYVLHLPVIVFSLACVLLILGGIVAATKWGYWPQMKSMLLGLLCVEMAFLLFDMVMGARVGAFLAGDAQVHLARIRFLLAHGFSNQDPFIELPGFFATYHTNLFHALEASCSQLTGIDYLGVWFASWVWNKLMFAAALYYLAWVVFANRWIAWVVGLFFLFMKCTTTYSVYPNQTGMNVFVALIIAFAIQVCRNPNSMIAIIRLAACTLVLGQFHGLYVGFACVAVGPILAIVMCRKAIKRQASWGMVSLALVALAFGTPFALVAKYVKGPQEQSQIAADAKNDPTSNQDEIDGDKFRRLSNGMQMVRPERMMGNRPALGIALVILGGTVTLVGRRRREGLMLLSIWLTVASAYYFPPFCTLLLKLLGAKWILMRIGGILSICLWTMIVGGLLSLLRPQFDSWWKRAFLSLAALLIANHIPYRQPDYSWSTYWERAKQPSALRHAQLNELRESVKLLRDAIPEGSVVLADGRAGRKLVMLADCHILAPDRSSPGANAYPQRLLDRKKLLNPKTEWGERKRLLDKYGIRHFLVTNQTVKSTGWLKGRIVNQWQCSFGALLEFNTN